MLITIDNLAPFDTLRSAILDTPERGGFTAVFKRYERLPETSPFVVGGAMGAVMLPKRYEMPGFNARSYGVSPTILARLMERLADNAYSQGVHGVGLWIDEQDGLWLDPFTLHSNKDAALDVAKERMEIAIYDLDHDETIPVPTDEKKTGNPLTRMLFGR